MSKYNPINYDSTILTRCSYEGAFERYGAAAPTTGPWKIGARIINTAPSSGIESWVCHSTGTFGSFSQAGTYVTGSAVVSGITTTGLNVNDFVNVNTGWSVLTGMRVRAVTANSVTLDANANGAGGAVTVARVNPVFYPSYLVRGTPSPGQFIKWNAGGYAEWAV